MGIPRRGDHLKMVFANGFTVSIVTDGYGSPSAPFEIAIFDKEGRWAGKTVLPHLFESDDVRGWLTAEKVSGILSYVSSLSADDVPP